MSVAAPSTSSLTLTQPHYSTAVNDIIFPFLQSRSKAQLKADFKISDKISSEVYQYYHQDQTSMPAVFTFTGPAFQGIDPESLSSSQLDLLNTRLVILSGLYGFLKPLDGVNFYRLDVADKLSGMENSSIKAKSFYEFWEQRGMTESIIPGVKILINLASQEYAKMIDMDVLEKHGVELYDVEISGENGRKLASHHMKFYRGRLAKCISLLKLGDNFSIEVLRQGFADHDEFELKDTNLTQRILLFSVKSKGTKSKENMEPNAKRAKK